MYLVERNHCVKLGSFSEEFTGGDAQILHGARRGVELCGQKRGASPASRVWTPRRLCGGGLWPSRAC
jgi:hypothetical protein